MRVLVMAGLVVAYAWSSVGAREPWSRDEVLALARERAPELLAARLAVDEARGRLQADSVPFVDNPVVDAAAGPRRDGDNTTDVEIGVFQEFGPPGRRRARIAAAKAGLAAAEAGVAEVGRDLLRRVALAYNRAAYARRRSDLLREAGALATQSRTIAQRRLDAGDVTTLDVNLATAAEAQARSDLYAAEASYAGAVGELQAMLGLPADEPLEVTDSLDISRPPELADLHRAAEHLPEFRGLDAEIRGAQAEQGEARSQGRPALGLTVRYAREQDDNVILGGLSVRLPVWNRGRGGLRVAEARYRRLELQREALRRVVDARIEAAHAGYFAQEQAVRVLETDALPLVDENERLVLQGYDEGENAIGDVLVVRRESLAARTAHLDRMLDLADAVVELEYAAGVLR